MEIAEEWMMAPIVKTTRYGETIFTSNPFQAARALVTWATEAYGHSLHCIERLEDGCVKVDIPGLTRITYAPEDMSKIYYVDDLQRTGASR